MKLKSYRISFTGITEIIFTAFSFFRPRTKNTIHNKNLFKINNPEIYSSDLLSLFSVDKLVLFDTKHNNNKTTHQSVELSYKNLE